MKNFTLLTTAVFMFIFSSINASTIKTFENPTFAPNFNDAEPIAFIERGIAFYIFPDGQFDFSTEPSRGDYFFRNGRRGSNINQGAAINNFGGVRIQRDNFGNIRRIGNVFINYDFNNRIARIGSVFIAYNRFAVSQVGGLRVIYNRFGQIIDFVGSVNGQPNFGHGNCAPNFNGNQNQTWNYNSNWNDNNNSNLNNNNNWNDNNNWNYNSNLNNNSNLSNSDNYFYKKSTDSVPSQNTKPANDRFLNRNGRR